MGEDDVFEGCLVVVRRDGVDFGIVERHAALQRRRASGSDPVEGRHAVGVFHSAKKAILARALPDLPK